MPIFMYILSYLLGLTTPIPSPIMILKQRDLVLWEARNTPASQIDSNLRRQIWRSLWRRHYSLLNKPIAKHLCAVKVSNVCKIIAASKNLGINGNLKIKGIEGNVITFSDRSQISLSGNFWYSDWRKVV